MAKQEITCDDILRELKAGQYRPIYYLMGEEPYYIDLISDYITDNVLNETEKEFNLTVVYGADVDVATIINAAKRYPMMSEHQVVVVKEAQNIRNIDELSYYLQKPLLSTILVICHKHGVLDKRKKLAAEIEKSDTAIAPIRLGASLDERKMAVGPSAPPMIPIAPACIGSNPIAKAVIYAPKIPNCAAAPTSISFGLEIRAEKSVIAPIPRKISGGYQPEVTP